MGFLLFLHPSLPALVPVSPGSTSLIKHLHADHSLQGLPLGTQLQTGFGRFFIFIISTGELQLREVK